MYLDFLSAVGSKSSLVLTVVSVLQAEKQIPGKHSGSYLLTTDSILASQLFADSYLTPGLTSRNKGEVANSNSLCTSC